MSRASSRPSAVRSARQTECSSSIDVRSPLAARRSDLTDVRSVWEAQPNGSSDVRSPLAARRSDLIVVRSAEDGRAGDLVAVRTGLADSTRSVAGVRNVQDVRSGWPGGGIQLRIRRSESQGSAFGLGWTRRMVGWPMVGVISIRVRSGVDEKNGRLADDRSHQDPRSERGGRKEWSAGRRSESPGNTTRFGGSIRCSMPSTFVRRP